MKGLTLNTVARAFFLSATQLTTCKFGSYTCFFLMQNTHKPTREAATSFLQSVPKNGTRMGKPSSSSSTQTRSESDKEKTKIRERHRRAITTMIFQGLRRYGNYRLSPRSDINEVLRELAKEAGWVVEPDGTTYRFKLVNRCPTCGTILNASAAATPTSTSSTVIGGGGGECSTNVSPCRTEPALLINGGKNNNDSGGSNANIHGGDVDIPLRFYMYGELDIHQPSTAAADLVGGVVMALPSQDQMARALNHSTPQLTN